ncbi:MAG TPA: DUF5668 domain-containing protein [Patescibacteria group bacterium]|nr:DUF5668 domain-containing protein [Patescibacteria group bacterium]
MSAAGGGAPAGYCRQCGKALTPETLREVQGAYYCPECLAGWVQQGPPKRKSAEGRAATAAALGIIPGLGAVYNGDYVKALIHVLVFGSIISLIDRSPGIFVPMLVAWIFYMPIEAYQTAKARAQSGTPNPSDAAGLRRRESIGPLLLIAIGTLALMNELNIIDFDRIISFWPVGLIALGVWLLMKRQEG